MARSTRPDSVSDSPAALSPQVDWDRAAATGRRLTRPGPKATPEQITGLVEELREASRRAVDPVARTSGLRAPEDAPPALIVDRAGWISANAASLGAMVDPLLQRALADQQQRSGRDPAAGSTSTLAGAIDGIGSGIAAAEAGAVLAWLSTKVLGQYDLAPQATPQLLLVAPNILAAERDLEVVPSDFRLWVALHEETHRVQFTAVPWLREHLIAAAQRLGEELVPQPEDLPERIREFAAALPGVLRGQTDITTVLAHPAQREHLARITAVMSLLEGHADVVMDDVGPVVVPTVEEIRRRFTKRRGRGGADKLLRRLIGLEAKMKQYRDGAGFVRGVIDRVGWEGFNHIWTSPDTLPEPQEIADPARWVDRVHR